MSSRRRSRYHGRTYHNRRPFLPILIFLLGVAILIFVLLKACSHPNNTGSSSHTGSQTAVSSSSGPTESPEPRSSTEPLPPLENAPWYLTLANADHPLPEDWTIETKSLANGLEVDSRIYGALTSMLNDCKAQGLSPIVCSAYRTISRQQELFDGKLDKHMSDGLSYDEAYEAASAVVAIPGTSEHNLGLAVDICALDYQILDEAQAETPEQKWLMEHCAEYGFILRYPKGKEDITGIIWEPWHYRYVGVELAKEITESGLCLEEYMAVFYSGV